MRILVVDDNETNLYMLQTLLPSKGYTVDIAHHGEEALQQLDRNSYNLIISDILMPCMDGFQLCREIRSDPDLKHIPFVFYTATYTSDEDEKFALRLGADRFIVKPQQPGALLEIIEQVLQSSSGESRNLSRFTDGDEQVYLKQYNERLIEKLEHKTAQLEEEKERYRVTIAAISDGIITTDRNAIVTHMNPAAEALTGWSLLKAVGKSLSEVCPLRDEANGADLPDPVKHYLQDGKYNKTPQPLLLKNSQQQEVAVKLTVTPLLHNDGSISGLIYILSVT